jgi:hypothetical protein
VNLYRLLHNLEMIEHMKWKPDSTEGEEIWNGMAAKELMAGTLCGFMSSGQCLIMDATS